MIEIKAYGRIENGCFYPRNPRVYLQSMKEAGNVSDCLLTIEGSNRRTPDQNAYCWAMCTAINTALATYGWVEFTPDDIYRRIEERYCYTQAMNVQTKEVTRYLRPLKKWDRQEFWEIIEKARIDYQEKLNIEIQTPAQFYGITEEAYDLWKIGAISFHEAKKMSDKVI